MVQSSSNGRKLIGFLQLPRFILLISPIIITFVLMFSGGHGYNILPGIVWFIFLCISQMGLLVIKSASKEERSKVEQLKLMDYSCGVFMGFNDNLSLVKKYSERIVFHVFTVVYLAIHLFAPGVFDSSITSLSGENQIYPIIFLSIIALIGGGDIARIARNCYSDIKEVIISIFIGIVFGALAFVSILFGKDAIFFNNAKTNAMIAKKCK